MYNGHNENNYWSKKCFPVQPVHLQVSCVSREDVPQRVGLSKGSEEGRDARGGGGGGGGGAEGGQLGAQAVVQDPRQATEEESEMAHSRKILFIRETVLIPAFKALHGWRHA